MNISVVIPARVTSVLREVGISPDFAGIEPGILEAARQRGLAVHAACQFLDEGDLFAASVDPRILPYVEAYRCFLIACGWRLLVTECVVIHRALGYRGRPDAIGMIAGNRWLLDRKATASIAPATAIQTAAYALAWDAMHPEGPITRRGALWLRRDGTYRLIEYDDPQDTQVWLAALGLYRDASDAVARAVVQAWRGRHEKRPQNEKEELGNGSPK